MSLRTGLFTQHFLHHMLHLSHFSIMSAVYSNHEKVAGLNITEESFMKLTLGEYDHLSVSRSVRSTYKLSTACMEMKRAGTLNVSKKTSAAFSLFLLGLSGASVSRTGCYQTQRCIKIRINKICWMFHLYHLQQEERRSSPPRRKSAAVPWSKHTARSSPCRSSPSRSRAPSGISPTTGPGAPGHHRQATQRQETSQLKQKYVYPFKILLYCWMFPPSHTKFRGPRQ